MHKMLCKEESFREEEEDEEKERFEREKQEQEDARRRKKESVKKRSVRNSVDEYIATNEEPKESEVKERRKRSSIKQKYQKKHNRDLLLQENNQNDLSELIVKGTVEKVEQKDDFVDVTNQKMDHNGNFIIEESVNEKKDNYLILQRKQRGDSLVSGDTNPNDTVDYKHKERKKSRKESLRNKERKKSALKKSQLKEVAGEDTDPFQINDLFNYISQNKSKMYHQPNVPVYGKDTEAKQIHSTQNEEEKDRNEEEEKEEEERQRQEEEEEIQQLDELEEEFKYLSSNSNATVVAEHRLPRALVKNELMRIQKEIVDEEEMGDFELESTTSDECSLGDVSDIEAF